MPDSGKASYIMRLRLHIVTLESRQNNDIFYEKR